MFSLFTMQFSHTYVALGERLTSVSTIFAAIGSQIDRQRGPSRRVPSDANKISETRRFISGRSCSERRGAELRGSS